MHQLLHNNQQIHSKATSNDHVYVNSLNENAELALLPQVLDHISLFQQLDHPATSKQQVIWSSIIDSGINSRSY